MLISPLCHRICIAPYTTLPWCSWFPLHLYFYYYYWHSSLYSLPLNRTDLDDAFASKNDLAEAVQLQLQTLMSEYGYEIIAALVVDLDPNARVKAAMNEINGTYFFGRTQVTHVHSSPLTSSYSHHLPFTLTLSPPCSVLTPHINCSFPAPQRGCSL